VTLVHRPLDWQSSWGFDPDRPDRPADTSREEGIHMISVGKTAPDCALKDHLGREVKLSDFRRKQHVLLLFYPLDWTPT
jgi:hypothetical protein